MKINSKNAIIELSPKEIADIRDMARFVQLYWENTAKADSERGEAAKAELSARIARQYEEIKYKFIDIYNGIE